MKQTPLTDEQVQILRENPYVYTASAWSVSFTKEFKEIFHESRIKGKRPREIFTECGFDLSILGEHRIKNIAYRIQKEYQKYGRFHEGYPKKKQNSASPFALLTDKEKLDKMQEELEFLREEMDFLKKISKIRTTGKWVNKS
jgi:hypothetical protein